ncbi:hypothetical protein ALO86_102267 [Pseudomonas syringae pv. berberidis]|nr:hypothetical protein ALO86_102267 [Pseudomonas syringae pv. berberidis]RMM23501.1 hypothetical protein ALQ83_102589 [Pseudomonas syringae pv. berberidis]RMQ40983.1 hypothetical protein ALQ06_102494 [Pseudomonas syringae pv. berberidis]
MRVSNCSAPVIKNIIQTCAAHSTLSSVAIKLQASHYKRKAN